MIILANLLVRSKDWRGAKITLKSVVPSEIAKKQQKLYFEEFFKKSRLGMNSEVYIIESEKSQRELISENSTKKGIVFASMKECDPVYYKGLIFDFKTIQTICFVTNCHANDLHTLLN